MSRLTDEKPSRVRLLRARPLYYSHLKTILWNIVKYSTQKRKKKMKSERGEKRSEKYLPKHTIHILKNN